MARQVADNVSSQTIRDDVKKIAEVLNREIVKVLRAHREAWNAYVAVLNGNSTSGALGTILLGASGATQGSFTVGSGFPDSSTPPGIYYRLGGGPGNNFFVFDGYVWQVVI